MTKTEAAENIANEVIVFSKRTGQPVTMDSIYAALSECAAGHRGSYLAASANAASAKTVATLVRKHLRHDSHLLAI